MPSHDDQIRINVSARTEDPTEIEKLKSHIHAADCGCDRHTSHLGCSPSCETGHGCVGTRQVNLYVGQAPCGCDSHGDHVNCSVGCQVGRGCQAKVVDERICGCTRHPLHDTCTFGCENTHCGYAPGRFGQRISPVQTNLTKLADAEAPSQLRTELYQWWGELARTEADQVIDKAIEYGSRDLVDIGRDLADCMHRKVTDQQAAELGVYFYLRGKMARATSALIRGEYPSDDTLKDIGVYVRMAQRIRSHGGWPGVAQ